MKKKFYSIAMLMLVIVLFKGDISYGIMDEMNYINIKLSKPLNNNHSINLESTMGFLIYEENDKLMEDGRKEFDENKRAEIYHEWGKLMNEELPYMYLTQNLNWDAVNARVKNWNTSPYVTFTNRSVLLEVEIGQ